MRGRRPDPAAVKEAKGNPSRRPIGKSAAETDAAGVVVPAWLKGEGRKVWERLAPRVMALKLLSPADADAFARYCRAFGRWIKVNKTLDAEGETYESESAHGKLKRVHPAFLISDRLERTLQTFEASFGLNPSERQRIFAQRAAGAGAPGDLFGGPAAHAPSQPVVLQPPAPRPLGLLN